MPSTARSTAITVLTGAAANLKQRLQEFRNIHADAQVGVSAVAAPAE